MKQSILAISLAAVATMGLVSCSGGSDHNAPPLHPHLRTHKAPPNEVTVSGTVEVAGAYTTFWTKSASSKCWTTGNEPTAFATPGPLVGIKKGVQVIITDASGRIVGTGKLQAGHVTRPGRGPKPCDFPFTVNSVPEISKFYTVKFAGHSITLTSDQLSAPVITVG